MEIETTAIILIQTTVLLIVFIAKTNKFSKNTLKITGVMSVILMLIAMLLLALSPDTVADILLIATYGVWLISLSRMISSHFGEAYVRESVLKDSVIFYLLGSIFFVTQFWIEQASGDEILASYIADTLEMAIIFIALILFVSTFVSLKKYKFKHIDESKGELPTVTLAIPARNETHALKQALESALSSNYEKLEVIVLDDCSQDSTSKIIKSFAHKGVRFVQGAQPASSWIGKNQAYKTLLEEASGDYVLFCGVDVHLSVDSISDLVKHIRADNLDMLSVLPQRLNVDLFAHIIQPMRYFWQLALPRFLTSAPSVLSSCWMIKRDVALELGGFDAVKSSIIPESYFARSINKSGKYRFVISEPELGVTTRKKPSSQLDTATRTLYPMLGRSLAKSWLAVLGIMLVFITPFFASFLVLLDQITTSLWVAALLLAATYITIMTRVSPASWFIGLIGFPISVVIEAVLILNSMWQYEFGKVVWKGRNICIPVIKSQPKLRN